MVPLLVLCSMAGRLEVSSALDSAWVWPLPQLFELSGAPVQISSDFRIQMSGMAAKQSRVVAAGALRYAKIIKNGMNTTMRHGRSASVAAQQLTAITVSIDSADEALNSRTCYNYTISMSSVTDSSQRTTIVANITAVSAFGALYGLESFAQLVNTAGWLPGSAIQLEDYPAYNYRGIMVDAGRRFWPLALLKTVVDAMAGVKLNVLHLHFSDNCRVGVESLAFPNLTSRLRNGPGAGFLTQREVKELCEYARLRGVRVLPEVELPGHAYHSLALPLGLDTCSTDGNFPGPVINGTNRSVATLEKLVLEMAKLFPDEVGRLSLPQLTPRHLTHPPNHEQIICCFDLIILRRIDLMVSGISHRWRRDS